ncbi:MAG: hypothetical protein ACSHXK_17490 [Oceanococcus sp.]
MKRLKLKLAYSTVITAIFCSAVAFPAAAQSPDSFAPDPTFADLADLADSSQIVLRAEIRKQAEVELERSPGLQPGFVRLYIEARTGALISGSAPIGESLRYLVDVPLDSRGKAPKLKKREVLLFANTVTGSPGAIRLVGPRAQLLWNDGLEARLRPILGGLLAADSPPVVTGVRDALTVAGNLSGESETQLFLDTKNGDPVSITVIRRPQQSPVWGVSWSEIVDQAARPPQRQSIAWYRLACFLPARLPNEANLSREAAMRNLADSDYAFVMSSLGPCDRNLGA